MVGQSRVYPNETTELLLNTIRVLSALKSHEKAEKFQIKIKAIEIIISRRLELKDIAIKLRLYINILN